MCGFRDSMEYETEYSVSVVMLFWFNLGFELGSLTAELMVFQYVWMLF